jgi:hypothetical protein
LIWSLKDVSASKKLFCDSTTTTHFDIDHTHKQHRG